MEEYYLLLKLQLLLVEETIISFQKNKEDILLNRTGLCYAFIKVLNTNSKIEVARKKLFFYNACFIPIEIFTKNNAIKYGFATCPDYEPFFGSNLYWWDTNEHGYVYRLRFLNWMKLELHKQIKAEQYEQRFSTKLIRYSKSLYNKLFAKRAE